MAPNQKNARPMRIKPIVIPGAEVLALFSLRARSDEYHPLRSDDRGRHPEEGFDLHATEPFASRIHRAGVTTSFVPKSHEVESEPSGWISHSAPHAGQNHL